MLEGGRVRLNPRGAFFAFVSQVHSVKAAERPPKNPRGSHFHMKVIRTARLDQAGDLLPLGARATSSASFDPEKATPLEWQQCSGLVSAETPHATRLFRAPCSLDVPVEVL